MLADARLFHVARKLFLLAVHHPVDVPHFPVTIGDMGGLFQLTTHGFGIHDVTSFGINH